MSRNDGHAPFSTLSAIAGGLDRGGAIKWRHVRPRPILIRSGSFRTALARKEEGRVAATTALTFVHARQLVFQDGQLVNLAEFFKHRTEIGFL